MSEQHRSQDLTGRRLGHYDVEGVIGRGGMSVLYRATDTRLGRGVALKVIDPVLAADPEFRDRFVQEARNTSAVDHAHVVPLYDFDETDGHLYIAMRRVDGPDLAALLRDGPLAPPRALALLDQVASALDAVHARGLVHLDVKPANVLVERTATGEHVYLADFGLTHRGATGHRTAAGDFLGSPTYAAPEHLRGEPVDARTDVYSLTCVLVTCLVGRAPYRGSVPEVIEGHLGGRVPTLTELGAPAGLDPRVDDVVRRGMDPDPPRRPGSAAEVVGAARAVLAGPTPGWSAPSPDAPVPDALVTGDPVPGAPVPAAPVPAGPVPAAPVPAGPAPAGPVPAGPVPGAPVPVRLRDPLPPTGDGQFVRGGSGVPVGRVVVATVLLAVLVVAVVVVVLVLP